MAWSDEPTPTQLGAVGRLIHWAVNNEIEAKALEYLERTATRQEVSNELGRLKKLYTSKKLTRDNAFDSPVWDDFEY